MKLKKVNKFPIGTHIYTLQYRLFDYEHSYWKVISQGKITMVRVEMMKGNTDVYYLFHKEYVFKNGSGCSFLQKDCFDSKRKAVAECKRRNALLKKQGKLWNCNNPKECFGYGRRWGR